MINYIAHPTNGILSESTERHKNMSFISFNLQEFVDSCVNPNNYNKLHNQFFFFFFGSLIL